MVLISLLCSTLTSEVNIEAAADMTSGTLFEVCSELAPLEPEFILKVLWCEGVVGWELEAGRQELWPWCGRGMVAGFVGRE